MTKDEQTGHTNRIMSYLPNVPSWKVVLGEAAKIMSTP